MNWRTWLYEAVQAHTPLITEIPADRWFSSASFTQKPEEKPFAIVSFGPETERAVVVRAQSALIWIYDFPGSFLRIDDLLEKCRQAIGQHSITGAGIAAEIGDKGPDSFDEDMKLIMRNLAVEFFARREE